MFGTEDFVRVFLAVVATQTQTVFGLAVDVFDAQHAVLFQGINFAVHDVSQAAINSNRRAALDLVRHAMANHRHANGVLGADVCGMQDRAVEANPLAGNFNDTGFFCPAWAEHFVVKRNVDVVFISDQFSV